MTQENVREFQSKFDALTKGYDIPFFFSVLYYRNEKGDINAMQLSEQNGIDYQILMVGESAFNACLQAMKANYGGKILDQQVCTTYTSDSNSEPKP